ncbi:MAG: BamA/TamA family outer membrane protein [bacterium]|nr:BamA/TamA family outer membrane protein [bacterium]
MRALLVAGGLLALLLGPRPAFAVQVEALDPRRDWVVGSLDIDGAGEVSAKDLRAVMQTQPRRWFAFWRPRPPFDPAAFEHDIENLRATYRSRGYYHAKVGHDVELPAEGDVLRIVIYVDEGPPVRVADVSVRVTDDPDGAVPRPQPTDLALEPGDVFTEERYDRMRAQLRAWYRTHARARVAVDKKARVDVRTNEASVAYTVVMGPACVFGPITVSGLGDVEEEVVRREISFAPGEPFSEVAVEKTRRQLEALRLFQSVRLVEDAGTAREVGMDVRLMEAPQHEVRFGIGYDTVEEVRGLAAWRDYNFYGGARQLGFAARASFLRRTITADFLQPHFPTQNSRVRLALSQEQLDEDTYTLLQTRGLPRLEWDVTPKLSVFGFYRAELDFLSDVPFPVEKALPRATPDQAVISALGFGLDWNAVDDLLDPSRGVSMSAVVEPVGGFLGGDADFVRLWGEVRGYLPMPWSFVGASRVGLGSIEPYGGTAVPIWERFYAGGLGSVRGYARRRVGPLVRDEPIGGKSIVVTSVELRHAITETIGAAGFVDAGQVTRASGDFPIDDMQVGVGVGARYISPVGPIRLDLGFPLDPRGDDAAWQVYVSVGQTF